MLELIYKKVYYLIAFSFDLYKFLATNLLKNKKKLLKKDF